MIKTKKQMFIVIGVFALVMMLGTVTFAFFNYTRTGSNNVFKVGRINFNTVQGPAINLNNAFPIDTEETGIINDATKVGTVTINVTGDTSYGEGIEYLVKAVNVENTINNKSVPISIDVSYVANGQGKAIGTEDEEYFDKRGGDTSYYKVLATGTISDDSDILVGYIAPSNDGTGIDGNIVIKAYIDKDKIAITDTYPEGDVTHTEGEEPNQETVVDYTNGTTSNWVGTRTVFTTTEWNNLQQAGGISFQVKVEANEGTWVEENLTVNAMNTFPTTITDEKANIKEVYFNKMGPTRMQNAYDAATIKTDLTYNNEGKVLAWLEENPDDNTKYNLIVASDGETYLTTGNKMFEYWENLVRIEFNNIITSRVTDMYRFMCMDQNLETIVGLNRFDTSSVTDMKQMFYYDSKITELDLSSFSTSSINQYNTANMFYMNSLLTKIYVSNLWDASKLSVGPSMFLDCTSLIGGNGTVYDSSKVFADMAVIDTPEHPGYFTDISLKPTN